ncbi:hypothetical protein [Kitasatospora griseola]|uniref:hypothetical protein n=1 Tax=Kitasatospora griseola TaxID=2064 RepID=UPI003669CDC6
MEDFAERLRGRTGTGLRKIVRTLAIPGYRLGADKPLSERDSCDLAQLDGHLATEPVYRLLRTRGLPADDPDLHHDRDLARIDRVLDELPQRVTEKVRAWVDVLRTQEPRHDEPRNWDGIRRYPTRLRPVPTAWTQAGTTGYRRPPPGRVGRPGGTGRRGLTIALRNLPRVLMRERPVFRDLARRLPVGDLTGIPRPVPLRPTGRPGVHPLPGRRPVHLPPPAPAHQRQPHLLVTQ